MLKEKLENKAFKGGSIALKDFSFSVVDHNGYAPLKKITITKGENLADLISSLEEEIIKNLKTEGVI